MAEGPVGVPLRVEALWYFWIRNAWSRFHDTAWQNSCAILLNDPDLIEAIADKNGMRNTTCACVDDGGIDMGTFLAICGIACLFGIYVAAVAKGAKWGRNGTDDESGDDYYRVDDDYDDDSDGW